MFRLLYELHAPGGLRHNSRYGLAYQEVVSMARNLEVDGAWETLDGKLSYRILPTAHLVSNTLPSLPLNQAIGRV